MVRRHTPRVKSRSSEHPRRSRPLRITFSRQAGEELPVENGTRCRKLLANSSTTRAQNGPIVWIRSCCLLLWQRFFLIQKESMFMTMFTESWSR